MDIESRRRVFWEKQAPNWSSTETHFLNRENEAQKLAVHTALKPIIGEITAATGRVLDIAGAGTTGIYLPQNVLGRTTVMDISHPALKANGAEHKVQANLETYLPFADKTYSFVTMFFVPRYIEGIAPVMFEIRRVLTDGGTFLALDYTENGFEFEQRDFNPHALAPFLEAIGFKDLAVTEVYPAQAFSGEHRIMRGPILSLQGRK